MTFGTSSNGWGGGFGAGRLSANSGLDVFGSNSATPAFVDVADVAGLQAALAQTNRG